MSFVTRNGPDQGTDAIARVARGLLLAFVVHDLEEVLTATWWSTHGADRLRRTRLPEGVVRATTATSTPQMAVATSVVGMGVAGVVAAALLHGSQRPLRATTLVFAAHGVTHLASAALLRGYTPGAVTAGVVVIPWGMWASRSLGASDDRSGSTRRRDTAAAAAAALTTALAGHLIGRRLLPQGRTW